MIETPFIPFNALHALALVARHGALGPAAEALGVTPGAVSQQIRRAETRAGLALFERTPKGLVPTRALLGVLGDLDTGFTALARAQANLMAPSQDRNLLTVTVGNVFASRWLIWRLASWGAVHPEVELKLLTTGTLVDLNRPDVDCGIRFGAGDWSGVVAEPIGTHAVFPVCAPALAERLSSPADLAHVPVIMDQSSMLSWPDWLAARQFLIRLWLSMPPLRARACCWHLASWPNTGWSAARWSPRSPQSHTQGSVTGLQPPWGGSCRPAQENSAPGCLAR